MPYPNPKSIRMNFLRILNRSKDVKNVVNAHLSRILTLLINR